MESRKRKLQINAGGTIQQSQTTQFRVSRMSAPGSIKKTRKNGKSPPRQNQNDLFDKNNKMCLIRWANSWESAHKLEGNRAFSNFIEGKETDEDEVCDEPLDIGDVDKINGKVYEILGQRISYGRAEYKVKWKNAWIAKVDLERLKYDYTLIEEKSRDQWDLDVNGNNEKTVRKSKRAKKSKDTDVAEADSQASQMADGAANVQERAEPTSADDLKIVLNDEKIKRIVKLGLCDDEKVFFFERLNGEYAVIPTRLANIKYPYAVIDFYEMYINSVSKIID